MANAREVHVWTEHAGQQLQRAAYTFGTAWRGDRFYEVLVAEPWTTVLDFGSGTGLWRGFFREANPRSKYIGLDQNEAMIAGAKQRWAGDDAEWILCPGISDGARIPLEDGSLDTIFTAAVLQHSCDADKLSILREFRRVLKTGGRYICFENTYGEHNGYPKDYAGGDGFSHSNEGWRVLIEPFGFVQEKADQDLYVYRVR